MSGTLNRPAIDAIIGPSRLLFAPLIIVLFLALAGCGEPPWNYPHAPALDDKITYQSTIVATPPKHLDPAISYATDESLFTMQIYEPPMTYHFLKRPYELIPGALAEFPSKVYLNAQGEEVDVGSDAVAFTRYELRLRDDLRYQPHPAFALDRESAPLYLFDDPAQTEEFTGIEDFAETGFRSVQANDYSYAIKRLADPALGSPMLGMMSQYIVGMSEFAQRVGDLEREGWLNLDDYALEGLTVVDEQTLRITIKGRYPQFLYWLAMPFFAPIAPEVDRFYHNPGFAEHNLTLNWWPVGSGPFMMVKNDPNREIVLERNPNYREEFYPTEGAPGDREAGNLVDAGKLIPFIDRAVFTLEREALPMWGKFMQGYYDRSGEVHGHPRGVFDQAFVMGANGVDLAESLKERGVTNSPIVKLGLYYYGFNMRDPTVGGYTEDKRKLRRALQIGFQTEDYLSIFFQAKGVPGHNMIPPGISGNLSGESGINSYVYDWVNGAAKRKPIEEAKRLLAEAGYPNGRDARTGEPLKIFIDSQSHATRETEMKWVKRTMSEIGVQVEYRSADFNRTREKLLTGNTQIFSHGWLADYPDPENFLFLMYSPESPLLCECDGANNFNYENEEYDELFREIRVMTPSPEREAKIAEMVEILRRDAIWLYSYYPYDSYLNNRWVHNNKRHSISSATLKYTRIDVAEREKLQKEWNKPVVWPLYAIAILLACFILPGVVVYRRNQNATVRQSGG